MEYQEAVRYLKTYRKKHEKLIYLNNLILGIIAIGYSEHMGARKSINDYLDDLCQLNIEMAKIENTIDNVKDETSRVVLGYKYLQFKTFEEIAEIMSYSSMQIKRFHTKGIKMLLNVTE